MTQSTWHSSKPETLMPQRELKTRTLKLSVPAAVCCPLDSLSKKQVAYQAGFVLTLNPSASSHWKLDKALFIVARYLLS